MTDDDPRLDILTGALIGWSHEQQTLVDIDEYALIVLRRLDAAARDADPEPTTAVVVGDTPQPGEATLCACGHTAHDHTLHGTPVNTACAETGCPCGRFRRATCDCN